MERQRGNLDASVRGDLRQKAFRDAAVPIADAAGAVEKPFALNDHRRLAVSTCEAIGIGPSRLSSELRNFAAKLALGEGSDSANQVDSLALRDGCRLEPIPRFQVPGVATAASSDGVHAEEVLHDVLLPHGAVDLVGRADKAAGEEEFLRGDLHEPSPRKRFCARLTI
jgi:hypothetical protein